MGDWSFGVIDPAPIEIVLLIIDTSGIVSEVFCDGEDVDIVVDDESIGETSDMPCEKWGCGVDDEDHDDAGMETMRYSYITWWDQPEPASFPDFLRRPGHKDRC